MRALLQRVSRAQVDVAGDPVGTIGRGLLVLLGVAADDTAAQAGKLAGRTLNLRIFPDADRPMNQSVLEIGGEVLIVPQFTLAADTRKGRRPGFSTAAPPEVAEPLYEAFVAACRDQRTGVATGQFGADMQVSLVNDGPVTFLLDT